MLERQNENGLWKLRVAGKWVRPCGKEIRSNLFKEALQ